MTKDDTRDLAIAITDQLVAHGIVPDCTDTDSTAEFNAQDAIEEAITAYFRHSFGWVTTPPTTTEGAPSND